LTANDDACAAELFFAAFLAGAFVDLAGAAFVAGVFVADAFVAGVFAA
jgi:hypothetical protein